MFQTLMNAWQASCLSGKYLLNWLNETSKQLSSLEKEAAPAGWKCEWDRYVSNIIFLLQLINEKKLWFFPSLCERLSLFPRIRTFVSKNFSNFRANIRFVSIFY